LWQGSGRANREESDRKGRVDEQHVVEGGGSINKCCAGGITVLYWWLSLFTEFMQQWLPEFAELTIVRIIRKSVLIVKHRNYTLN
jgi:hypothetical protein